MSTSSPLWSPHVEKINSSLLKKFQIQVEKKYSVNFKNYKDLHQWSITEMQNFWSEVWDFCNVIGEKGNLILQFNSESQSSMMNAQWFPKAKLNYAENLLRYFDAKDSSQALVFWSEDKIKKTLSKSELYAKISQCVQLLESCGVQKGDRVCGLLPNCPEAIVTMLATATLGAVWSSASPDFGVQGVLDRFGQIKPKVLFVTDGYYYAGKGIDCREKNLQIEKNLNATKSFCISMLNLGSQSPFFDFEKSLQVFSCKKISYTRVSFSHPLFVMYSSGTTGVPKCIVHGHGGVLLQHLKEHQLHGDIKAKDRLFYFTTLGWMMWNWMVTALASDAVLLLYDGSPFAAEKVILFDFLQQEKCTHFGTSAKYIDTCAKYNLCPQQTHNIKSIRSIFSTGSPLSADSFKYVYKNISKDVALQSISGGTDIISCFVLGNPYQKIYAGEIQGPGLGMDVQIYNEQASRVYQQKGELVCSKPFPSQPVGFWKDDKNEKYFNSYFSKFKNVWCHGDFVEETGHGGYIIYGRSDAVLNPGGVRIGTAEIYRQVECLSEILESIVVGQNWQNDVRVVLFVKLQPGLTLTDALEQKIKLQIKNNTTPRHVPAKILQVGDIPRTKSGKIVELAVKKIIHNEVVNNIEALANPEALEYFKNRNELQD